MTLAASAALLLSQASWAQDVEGCAADREDTAMLQVNSHTEQVARHGEAAGGKYGYNTFLLGNWSATTGGELCDGLSTAGQDHNEWQSPIDFAKKPSHYKALHEDAPKFYAKDNGCPEGVFRNTGHNWQVDLVDDTKVNCTNLRMWFKKKSWTLVQFHFHIVSEHTVDFLPHQGEMHMVHVDEDGNLAVVGVFIDFSCLVNHPNQFLEHVFSEPEDFITSGTKVKMNINPYDATLTRGGSMWHYQGSLTTPPCSPGVTWLVNQAPVYMKKETLGEFRDSLKEGGDSEGGDVYGNNRRPAQALNARPIWGTFVDSISHHHAPPVRRCPFRLALEA